MNVPKLEAARRQLATAIQLWFHDVDEVSIHTLAFAAYEVIHYVSKKRGRTRDLLFDTILVKDEHRKVLNTWVKKAANFFKHADQDPDETIDFQPRVSEGFIMFAIVGLHSMGITLNRYESAFAWWFVFHSPELLTQGGQELLTKSVPAHLLAEIKDFSKLEFFQACLKP